METATTAAPPELEEHPPSALPGHPVVAAVARRGALLTLLAALLVGGWLRLRGNDWDQGQHLHPDERFITMVITAVEWPDGWTEYFDSAASPLNPYNQGYGSYVYGTLPLFLTKLVGDQVGQNEYHNVNLLGRRLSALFDLASIVLIFLIGRELLGRRVGALAAVFLALSVLHIQLSHYFTFDTFATTLLLASFYFALRVARDGGPGSFVLAGAFFGLSLASKVSSYPLGGVLVLAGGLRLWRKLREPPDATAGPLTGVPPAADEGTEPGAPTHIWALVAVGGGLAVSLLVAAVLFRLLQPYAFEGPHIWDLQPAEQWLQDVGRQRAFVEGKQDYPPSHQWAFTTPYLYPLKHMLLWGLGPPLGLAGWAGMILLALRPLAGGDRRLWLVAAWVGYNFYYYGGLLAKPMRYLMPIYPFLALAAAYLLVFLWGRAQRWRPTLKGDWAAWRRRIARQAPRLVLALGAVTVGYTAFWALAFSQIYGRPLSRVVASEWIYEHVPVGSTLAVEHWDDSLPLPLPGRDPRQYKFVEMTMYDADTPQKLEQVVSRLGIADYIVLSSNRLYKAIPRLRLRYPMTTEYYRLLLDEELGFKLVGTFASRPSLLGVVFRDDEAEESFTVYDHPKVLIFQKTASFSKEDVAERLGAVDLDSRVDVLPLKAPYNALLMTEEEARVQRQGGTWSALFDRDSFANSHPLASLIVWLLAVEAAALAVLPLALTLFRALPDRGYLLAKPLGILLVAYLTWLGASLRLVAVSRTSVVLALLLVAAVSFYLWRRRGQQMRAFVQGRWRMLAVAEGVFLAAFLVFVIIRVLNPDLWHPWRGGEKPMDFAYLNAVVKSTYLPPYDPWFAGGYINYYYLGQFILACFVHLTGILPSVAFNLAVPTLFALTFAGVYSLLHNLAAFAGPPTRSPHAWRRAAASPYAAGLTGAVFVAVLGNLDGLRQLFDGLRRASPWGFESAIPGLAGAAHAVGGLWQIVVGGRSLPRFDYWASSRMMPPEPSITEFPYFTFLFADPHAHLIALPFTVLVLGIALALVLRGRCEGAPEHKGGLPPEEPESASGGVGLSNLVRLLRAHLTGGEVALLGLLGLAVGTLRWTNSWDFPTYLLFAIAAAYLADLAARRRLDLAFLLWPALKGGLVFAVAHVLYLPFQRRYELFYSGVEGWNERTPLPQYLGIFGLFLFLIFSFLLLELYRQHQRRPPFRLLRLGQRFWWRFPSIWDLSVRLRGKGAPRADEPSGLAVLVVGVLPCVWWLAVLYFAGHRRDMLLAGLLLLALALLAWANPRLRAPLLVLGHLGLVLFLILVGRATVAAAQAVLVLAAAAAERRLRRRDDLALVELFALGTMALPAALTSGIEFLRVEGDIDRMNTVFKFYLQAWVLFAVASSYAIWRLLAVWRVSRGRVVWLAALVVLLGGSAVYPLLATPARIQDRFAGLPAGLDGMEFMARASYVDDGKDMALPEDYAAIRWLQENIEGSPVVLEGVTPINYRWGNRVSVYTGLPAVIGWDWHQKQQRWAYQGLVDQRRAAVEQMYRPGNVEATVELLRRYDVRYVYVGALERAYYGPGVEEKFDALVGDVLVVVYDRGAVKIYQVLPEEVDAPPT